MYIFILTQPLSPEPIRLQDFWSQTGQTSNPDSAQTVYDQSILPPPSSSFGVVPSQLRLLEPGSPVLRLILAWLFIMFVSRCSSALGPSPKPWSWLTSYSIRVSMTL